MKLVICLFIFHVASGSVVRGAVQYDTNVKIHSYSNRISNGQEAINHEFPWMVALKIIGAQVPAFCGGTLISPEYVLTSAYCIENAVEVDLILGAFNINNASEFGQIRMKSRYTIVHPEWNPTTLAHDIGLVKLPTPVQYSPTLSNVRLYFRKSQWKADFVNIAGWGRQTANSSLSDKLMFATTRILEDAEDNCPQIYSTLYRNTDHFCIGGVDQKVMCNGDEGGPLNFYSIFYKQNFVVAVASYGVAKACEKEQSGVTLPSIYTQVYKYLDWIKQYTPVLSDPTKDEVYGN